MSILLSAMNHTGYKTILEEAVSKLGTALQRSHELETEIAKLKQLIHATMNMLPDDERAPFVIKLDDLDSDEAKRASGLTDAISRILAAHLSKWLTATQVRDRLLESGFDFSDYRANPLASVSTTLKRMVNRKVKATTIEGVTAYRWITRFPRAAKELPKNPTAVKLGQRGGKAPANKISKQRRKEIARLGGLARWKKKMKGT